MQYKTSRTEFYFEIENGPVRYFFLFQAGAGNKQIPLKIIFQEVLLNKFTLEIQLAKKQKKQRKTYKNTAMWETVKF